MLCLFSTSSTLAFAIGSYRSEWKHTKDSVLQLKKDMSWWYFCSSIWCERLSCTVVSEVTGKSLAQARLAGSTFFHSPTVPIGPQGTVSVQLLSGSDSQVSFLCLTFQEREQYPELYIVRSQVITRKVSDIELLKIGLFFFGKSSLK